MKWKKGFSKPILRNQPLCRLPNELAEANANILAHRKLNLILRSHSQSIGECNVGDLVQVCIKTNTAKRGSWSSPGTILSINHEGGFFEVPGRAGKRVTAVFEDTRIAPSVDSFSEVVKTTIEDLDDSLDELLDLSPNSQDDFEHENEGNNDNRKSFDVCDISESNEFSNLPIVCNKVQIYWPTDNIYYSGAVSSIDDHGNHVILHNGNEKETLKRSNETWQYEKSLQSNTSGPVKKF